MVVFSCDDDMVGLSQIFLSLLLYKKIYVSYNYNNVQKKHNTCIIISYTKVEQRQLFSIVAHRSRSIQNVTLLNITDQIHTCLSDLLVIVVWSELQSTLFCITAKFKFVSYKTFIQNIPFIGPEIYECH